MDRKPELPQQSHYWSQFDMLEERINLDIQIRRHLHKCAMLLMRGIIEQDRIGGGKKWRMWSTWRSTVTFSPRLCEWSR